MERTLNWWNEGKLGNLVILVNRVILMEVSAKPELPFIDVQGLDPMVEGGGWNAKLRRRA